MNRRNIYSPESVDRMLAAWTRPDSLIARMAAEFEARTLAKRNIDGLRALYVIEPLQEA